MVQVQVHLIKRLLGMLQVPGRFLHQPLALAGNGPHGQDLRWRHEALLEQPHAVQILQPLAVRDVALGPVEPAHIARLHEGDVDPGLHQFAVERRPVDTGGFHRHRANAARDQEGHQLLQPVAHGREGAHRLALAVRRHRHPDVGRHRQVDASGIGSHHR